MPQFIKDIFSRNGEGSSKKLWYNVACCAATIALGWVCYKDTMEDYAFITFYGVYLGTVGGFEVVLEMIRLIKGGKIDAVNTPVAPQ